MPENPIIKMRCLLIGRFFYLPAPRRFPALFALFLTLASCPVFAFSYAQDKFLPDSSDVRKKLDSWFTAPLGEIREKNNELHTSDRGQVFQVRLEETQGAFNIVIAPREQMIVDVYSDDGMYSEITHVYISNSPGSWTLTRDAVTGKPLSIVYFFSPNANVFVKLTPGEKKFYADLVIFGSFAARGVEVGIPFERLYGASLSDLRNWTPSIPWFYATLPNSRFEGVRRMIGVIRDNQKRFIFAPNAAYDEAGEPVDILSGKRRTVNPASLSGNKLEFSDAGFLKWIIDGLVEPFSDTKTSLAQLLAPTVNYKSGSFQDTLAHQYNLSFALDWTRNLAAAVISVKQRKTFTALNSGVDVAVEPFALSANTTYTKNSGYPADGLIPVLYTLTATDPDMFYLAAVRQTDLVSPEVHFFSKCAAIFPYFDDRGKFNVSVFENGNEMTLAQFVEKYKKNNIHLVRVSASDRFFPQ
jgi:hypothetical protein